MWGPVAGGHAAVGVEGEGGAAGRDEAEEGREDLRRVRGRGRGNGVTKGLGFRGKTWQKECIHVATKWLQPCGCSC